MATDPGVPTFCLFANDTQTWMSGSMENITDENRMQVGPKDWGDSTVPLDSLRHCKTWTHTEQVGWVSETLQ